MIATAEEYINKYSYVDAVLNEAQKYVLIQFMQSFAKLHVEAALKAAVDQAEINDDSCYGEGGYCRNTHIIESTILNAYPIDNIK